MTTLPLTEQAFRSTLVQKAKGETFDQLCRMYGLPRPAVLGYAAHRAGMREAAIAPRGTRGVWHAYLEAALGAQWGTLFQGTIAAAAPTTLTWVSGGTFGGWDKSHVHRLWRIFRADGRTQLLYSKGPTFAAPGASPTLDLCPFGTAYWEAPAFLDAGGAESISALLLPFVWSEVNGRLLLALEGQSSPPATYLQPLVRWAMLLGGGAPGASFFLRGTTGPGDPGRWDAAPSVVEDDVALEMDRDYDGIWDQLTVVADSEPTDAAPARGGSYTVRLRVNSGAGWVDTALVCTLGAADTVVQDLTHVAVIPPGAKVGIKVTAGAGVTQPIHNLRVVSGPSRPAGQPKGGDILEGVAVAATSTGPWPLYLGGGVDAELLSMLSQLIPAGVRLEMTEAVFSAENGVWP